MVGNAWLRPGNTFASSNCLGFMEETFTQALAGKKVGLVRGDSGFYSDQILSYLEAKQLNHIVAVKSYPNIKSQLWGLHDWIRLADGSRTQ